MAHALRTIISRTSLKVKVIGQDQSHQGQKCKNSRFQPSFRKDGPRSRSQGSSRSKVTKVKGQGRRSRSKVVGQGHRVKVMVIKIKGQGRRSRSKVVGQGHRVKVKVVWGVLYPID